MRLSSAIREAGMRYPGLRHALISFFDQDPPDLDELSAYWKRFYPDFPVLQTARVTKKSGSGNCTRASVVFGRVDPAAMILFNDYARMTISSIHRVELGEDSPRNPPLAFATPNLCFSIHDFMLLRFHEEMEIIQRGPKGTQHPDDVEDGNAFIVDNSLAGAVYEQFLPFSLFAGAERLLEIFQVTPEKVPSCDSISFDSYYLDDLALEAMEVLMHMEAISRESLITLSDEELPSIAVILNKMREEDKESALKKVMADLVKSGLADKVKRGRKSGYFLTPIGLALIKYKLGITDPDKA